MGAFIWRINWSGNSLGEELVGPLGVDVNNYGEESRDGSTRSLLT